MTMPNNLNWISNYVWGIADDVLHDVYVSGKYRDVILPMTVLRRLDAVLEDTKENVLQMKKTLDKNKIVEQKMALCHAAGQAFYNTSKFTLRDLRARGSVQQLRSDFEAYLDGFSPNVQDIFENFEFRNQIPRLSKADALGTLIEKLTSPDINLSPKPVLNDDKTIRLPGLDNHGMGTIFEELVRRFNEKNNEEAGEHWTPRDAVKLMAQLVFRPVADQIKSGTYLLYDGACGTGGILTVAEETLKSLASEQDKKVSAHLYGQEINAETYAICKADMILKGEGEAADNIVGGPEHSTLTNDAFPTRQFDFMLSNPPYGKNWKSDLEHMGSKKDMRDPRFLITHAGDPEYSLVTRSSDGQMLFLANKVSKMKNTKLGSRIAEVHNGSSLFTGDAGQGESNIRRWIIENDWLEAIVALPLNMFYNTGIATYIWVLGNRKAAHRKGKVQLIDATAWFKSLRKNLGNKNCELGEADIERICETFLNFEENEQSKIFPNEAFGYYKVTVERPLRIKGADPERIYKPAEIKQLKESGERTDDAPPILKKIHKKSVKPDPLHGRFTATVNGKSAVVEYERDPALRDTEQIPLLEEGGIDAFLAREVLPHAPGAWYDKGSVKIGYEINFNRHFYKPKPLRPLNEIRRDITALEHENEGLLNHAVTRGLDPSAPLKDSGVEWLGEVPAHWTVAAVKRHYSIQLGKMLQSQAHQPTDVEVPYLKAQHVQWFSVRTVDAPTMWASQNDIQQFSVREGDLLVCEGGEGGRCGIVEKVPSGYIMQNALHRVRSSASGQNKFLQYVMSSVAATGWFDAINNKATIAHFTVEKFASLQIAVPPIHEQTAIVEHLDKETTKIDAAITRARREIELLNEYRTRLIADVVTGKVDIREAAANLPAEPDEQTEYSDEYEQEMLLAVESETPYSADDVESPEAEGK